MFSSLSPTASIDQVTQDVIKDVTLATFKADVLEASKQAVVLVDFWATWCGPCKQLTPMLEKIARESKGAVRLAKIDVDKNQPIAQQMGVQSVPSVFAFVQGRPVDAFAGALPEAQIKTWVEQLVKASGINTGDDKAGLEIALQQAADLLAAQDISTARSIYADILDMEPGNVPSYAGLIRCLLEEKDFKAAREMFDATPPEMAKNKIFVSVRAALELAEQVGQDIGQVTELESKLTQNPADHQARFDLALTAYAAGDREKAVDCLLEIVKRARTWNEDAARKQLVKFFEAFGATDPLTISSRKRLSSILFS
jgi:putative thioredoxin